ncbi:ankyrin repeat domain-containing protein 6 isoform X1 [Poeciliopsis prolifica]|uniref:ankyrin repeat domain-containing protein 6 isoform X1 n=1 Tax=Poeciliopsis prolifica TaxID=188132 RepID=UPI00241382B7|nr:ankyrin repeat domain-containing protein 6 isoform X1 [Poeciliopsis prolifica]XP_054909112.1 ankyrin repeat domain-containing protein 6 isoform X1 [Poeciliopsis prolifica]
MAAFCSRDSVRSSDVENLVCTLSSSEGVENSPHMKVVHCRPGGDEVVHSKMSRYQTALHRSAMVGNSETMAALIAGGCAVDLQDPLGNTALHEASWHGFTQCVKLLVKAGADVRVKNKAGNSALHLACQNAHAATAQLLLLGGSNPDAKNKVGDSCLHVAARYNNLNLLKILLRSRCRLNETNQVGDTALHVASALNHRKAVQLLLSAGLDVRVRNNAGKTALDKAREHQSRQVALLLSKVPQVRYMRRKTMRKPRLRPPTRPAKVGALKMEQTEPRSGGEELDAEDLASGRKHNKSQKDEFWDEGGKTFQLYTLYRDREGRVRQAPASGCICESLLKKLQGDLTTTKQELRLQILHVQEELHSQMDRMERRNKHQLRKLEMLIQEKAASERRSLTSRMEQRAAQDRAEALRNQDALRYELKSWCLSLLEDLDISVPAETVYQNLLLSPSAAETDLESVPLLFSGDSSPCVSASTLTPGGSERLRLAEPTGSRTYFEMKVDRCADYSEKPSSSTSTGPQEEGWSSKNDTMVLEFLMDRPADPTFIQERKHLHAMEVTQQFFDAVSAQLERWCSRKILEVEFQSELRAQTERKEMLQRIGELEEELHRLQTNEEKECFLRPKKSDFN